jgi:hypothetical protein
MTNEGRGPLIYRKLREKGEDLEYPTAEFKLSSPLVHNTHTSGFQTLTTI